MNSSDSAVVSAWQTLEKARLELQAIQDTLRQVLPLKEVLQGILIENLDIPKRAKNAIKRHGVYKTAWDICGAMESDLYRVPDLGPKANRTLKAAILDAYPKGLPFPDTIFFSKGERVM